MYNRSQHKLKISDNLPKEDRARERAVGKVKRALMEVDEDRVDVVVDYASGEVWVGEERVAKWTGDGLKTKGEALSLKDRIDSLMAERRPQDELSE